MFQFTEFNRLCNVGIRKFMFIDLLATKKITKNMTYCFKLNICMVFNKFSAFSPTFFSLNFFKSLISSRVHCQRSSPLLIADTLQAGFEPAKNLSSGLVEWSCAVVITTTSRCHKPRTWYYFWLCFSFICSGYDIIVIKKNHTLNCYWFLWKSQTRCWWLWLLKLLLKWQTRKKAIYFLALLSYSINKPKSHILLLAPLCLQCLRPFYNTGPPHCLAKNPGHSACQTISLV